MTSAATPRQIDVASTRTERPIAGSTRFMLDDWLVDVQAHRLVRGDVSLALEPLHMAVLAELCRRPGEVISAESLLDACWPGETLGDNPVHKVIAGLRRAVQDSATQPRYIETIRKRGYRVVAPIRVLSEQGLRSHQGGWRGKSPFRGLESFGVEHASVFFGRDEAVIELQARLAAQWHRGHPLVVLLGPSGSGKTSLVQAGLLTALQANGPASDDGHDAPSLRICTVGSADLGSTTDSGPWTALAGALLDWECADAPLLAGHSIESLAQQLRNEPGEAVRLLRIGLNASGQPVDLDERPLAPPLLVLDRLEALFQAAAEVNTFIECVEGLVQSGMLLALAVCRNDFYPHLAGHPALMIDKEHGAHMDLAPPDADAFAQMIRRPARAAGLVFGTDASGMNRLDDRLCADALHARDALPMLQYTLQALYLERAPGNELTWAAYDGLGGLEGAIGRRAESTLLSLPQGPQEAFSRLLPRLVDLSAEQAEPTSRWVPGSCLGDDDERALLNALVDARLLVADHVGGVAGFRVAHEALLRRWPRVTAWVAQHRRTLVTRGQLMPWVQRWQDGAQASPLLLPRGSILWQAGAALTEAPQLFDENERTFVQRSLSRVSRQSRWRWAASAVALILAVLAGVAAVRYAALARVASERELQSQRLASFMLGDLADQLRPIGKLDLLGSIGDQGYKLLTNGDERAEPAADVLQRAKALVVIGEVNSSRGKGRTDVATAALTEAGRLLGSLERADGLPPAEYYKTLGASAFWLGQIAFDEGRLDTASRHMSRYRDACELWQNAVPNDARADTEMGFALSSLGSIAVRRGAWSEARRWFESSLSLKLRALSRSPGDTDTLDAIASSRTWLGQIATVQGEPRQAMAHFDVALDGQTGMLAQHSGEFVRLHALGILHIRRAEALHALGQYGDAVRSMGDAVTWLDKAVAHDPGNQHWQAERVHAEAGLQLLRLDTQPPAAEEWQALLRRLSAPAAENRAQDYLWREAIVRLAVVRGELAARRGDWQSTLDATAEGDRLLEPLLTTRPSSWQTRELQARVGLQRMRALTALGLASQRAAACSRTASQLHPTVISGQGGIVLEAWLVAQSCAGSGKSDAEALGRLTAGGYRPTTALLPTLTPRRSP